jgi:hypothetical protein
MRLRRGIDATLEAEADRLIKESLKGVTKHSEKSDLLTPWKQAERYRREVYPRSGVADSTRRGNFNRVINPGRPDLNSREGTAPRPSSRDFGLVAHMIDGLGDDADSD